MKFHWMTSRSIGVVVGLLLLYSVTCASAEPRVLGVGALGLTVSDMDQSIAFFTRVLTFEKVADVEFHNERFDRLTGVFGARVRIVTMKLGQELIELTEYLTPPGRPIPGDSHGNDFWFQHIAIVVRDLDTAYERLRQLKVRRISTEPQRVPDWNQAAAGIRAFRFRDPDNHSLELIYFPPGKGDPRWQVKTDALFLGIDHTAIAVADTDRSLRFYRDLLGFDVDDESVQYGVEQEYLDHVFGSRVRITGLRTPQGPGIELLEYLTPTDGQPYPADARPNDLMHRHITLRVEDPDELLKLLTANDARLISPSVVEIAPLGLGGKNAALLRDPDAHALNLLEP